MDQKELYEIWKREEEIAHIKGWDFSHIHGKYEEEDELPWDFRSLIQAHLRKEMRLLDMETGGGEFLRSLGHPTERTAAIEGYPPNVEFCRKELIPLGIDFREADGSDVLPFEDASFDIITNRHGDYLPSEMKRLLKPNGLFLTQQVGAENDRELVQLLMPEITELPYPDQVLSVREKELRAEGFEILSSGEVFQPIRFFDVGALVWFARIIEWEFPGFSVDTHLPQLYRAQELLEREGVIEGRIHRFYLIARKGTL